MGHVGHVLLLEMLSADKSTKIKGDNNMRTNKLLIFPHFGSKFRNLRWLEMILRSDVCSYSIILHSMVYAGGVDNT